MGCAKDSSKGRLIPDSRISDKDKPCAVNCATSQEPMSLILAEFLGSFLNLRTFGQLIYSVYGVYMISFREQAFDRRIQALKPSTNDKRPTNGRPLHNGRQACRTDTSTSRNSTDDSEPSSRTCSPFPSTMAISCRALRATGCPLYAWFWDNAPNSLPFVYAIPS